jgi:hypothetical protein
VLDIDLDVRISGVIGLGGDASSHRFRIEQAPRGVLRALEAAVADIHEDVQGERRAFQPPYQDESLRLLPYSGGSGARDEVRQLDRRDRPVDREVQSPSSYSQQEAAEKPRFHKEVAEAEHLLKSLASALALRLLSRAATKTRQAIAEAKRAMKSKDAERIRQANERLEEAAMHTSATKTASVRLNFLRVVVIVVVQSTEMV